MENQTFTPSRNYCGVKEEVIELLGRLRTILYPQIFGPKDSKLKTREQREDYAHASFKIVLRHFIDDEAENSKVLNELLNKLPRIEKSLMTDVEAAYRGDPAAHSYDEIMLAYPSFEAVTIHRIAHELYKMKVSILPRLMSEYAHSITGIDIHPGATIGDHFFIDHGTGVVIGETATIGTNVKIYQGVTIGAKSFKEDKNGNLIKGIKRHPDIGNNVIIYAGATILGGDTTIGDDCIIGGNIWLTHSIEPNNSVYAQHAEVRLREIE